MKPKQHVRMLVLASITLGAISNPWIGLAADNNEYSFDQVVVTALRIESKDLETPAYINTYTQEQLQATGACNILDAVRFTEGITYNSMGPAGQSWGGMTSKAVIRGSEKGTLVLLNGVPMNIDGYYNLEDIPVQNVERVEILKGAASVLYGSEAFGGVINIITKKQLDNSVTISQGNFGQKNHSITLREGNFSVTGVTQEIGTVKRLADTGYGYGGNEKQSVQWQYKLNDQLTLFHQHVANEYTFDKYVGSAPSFDWTTKNQSAHYDDVKDYLRLNYDGQKWDVNAYGNFHGRDYEKYTGLNTASPTHSNSEEYQVSEQGVEAQTTWKTPFANFLGGFGYTHENFEKTVSLPTATYKHSARNNYSVFLQGSKNIGKDVTVILGARQEYVNTDDENISAFCPQLQMLKKLDKHKTWYINTGKSFKMPTFSQLYDTSGTISGANSDLKPEEGWNYETGMKWEGKDSSVKTAIFHMDYDTIKFIDQYPADPGNDYYIPQNVPFRNTGVEVSYHKKLNNAFSYLVGASYGNPEIYESNKWKQQYGRMQLNTALKYKEARWAANLTASYLSDRVNDWKPQLPINLTAAYTIDQDKKVMLVIENVLDRHDVNTHGTTAYYALPRSYRLSYTQKF